jgi:peptide chain release factor subunit 1
MDVQTSAPARDQVRRLSELRLERPRVLSIYLDVRPSEFATGAARASAVRSVLDRAERRVRAEDLDHDDRRDLERSLERARAELEAAVASAKGAHGLAVFSSAGAGLFEVVRVPHEIESQIVVDRTPHVAPLAALASEDGWCVALVNRSAARVLRGSPDRLVEVGGFDDEVHGQHDQGGWSQARYQRSVDKEVSDHVKRVAAAVFRLFERRPFEHLLVGGPAEIVPELEERLHPYVAEHLSGRVEVDVENSSPEEILDAAQPAMEEVERSRERRELDRLASGNRATAGLDDVLGALNEHRVEALLLAERFEAPGVVCPRCGWLGAEGAPGRCPVDGTRVEDVANVAEPAVERALQQSAAVRTIRHHDELRDRGGIGALLRF